MRKEIKIGIAGIAALALLIFGINYLKGINLFKSEHSFHVEFTNVNGLTKSSPVFASGYQIGIVKDVRYNYDKPGHIVVSIDVEEDFKVPQGSTAELTTDMLGSTKMDIILNHGTKAFLNTGDTIAGTTNNGLMGAAQEKLLPQIEKILPKLDSILTSVNTLLSDPALKNTLHNAEQTSKNLHLATQQLNRVMNTDIPVITRNVAQMSENFKVLSDSLQQIDYVATFNSIETTLRNVQALTDKLNRNDGSLGLLMNDPALYNNLNATMNNAAALLKDLQTNPKRYVHFSLFGRKDKKQEAAK